MSRNFKATVIGVAMLTQGLLSGAGPARADGYYTYTEEHYNGPVVTTEQYTTTDETADKCLDHDGLLGPDGCYIPNRNDRIKLMEEENSGFRFRAHEAGVYDRD